jgi:UTP:GlnB (protein PII) uridylyltransferase
MEAAVRTRAYATDELAEFVRSMPPFYTRLFGYEQIQSQHAIVRARGQRTAHADLLERPANEPATLCVVAAGRTALLSLISDALSSQELDVLDAQIYSRRAGGGARETVALLWVEREPGSALSASIDSEDVRNVSYALAQLIEEQQRADEAVGEHGNTLEEPRLSPPRVYYDTRALRQGEVVLIVETPDCPGLLLAVTRALFRHRAEIVTSEVRTEAGTARDRFTICGAAGSALTPDRLADVQQGVLAAVRTLVVRRFGSV